MELSKAVASLALILAVVLATGYARGADLRGPAAKEAEREAMRRAALADHHKRKEAFARLCGKPYKNAAELEACRAAYRRL